MGGWVGLGSAIPHPTLHFLSTDVAPYCTKSPYVSMSGVVAQLGGKTGGGGIGVRQCQIGKGGGGGEKKTESHENQNWSTES